MHLCSTRIRRVDEGAQTSVASVMIQLGKHISLQFQTGVTMVGFKGFLGHVHVHVDFFVQIVYVTKQLLPVVIWRSDSCSTLFRVKVCCLLRTKPLPAPMLAYCWIDHWEQSLVIIESKYHTILSEKCFWKSPFQRDDSRRIFFSGFSYLVLVMV